MSQMYEVVVRASGEVRDADGSLINPVSAESTHLMSRNDLKANGLTDEQIDALTEGKSS